MAGQGPVARLAPNVWHRDPSPRCRRARFCENVCACGAECILGSGAPGVRAGWRVQLPLASILYKGVLTARLLWGVGNAHRNQEPATCVPRVVQRKGR